MPRSSTVDGGGVILLVQTVVTDERVCPVAYLRNHIIKFHRVFCAFSCVAIARFSPDGVAICYVPPVPMVLFVTSNHYIMDPIWHVMRIPKRQDDGVTAKLI